jgi:hypothetical protein
MTDIKWDIRRKGRSWTGDEADVRYFAAPEKLEMVDGKFYDYYEERLHMPGCLLENLGAEAATRLGDPQVWREAIANLADDDQ